MRLMLNLGAQVRMASFMMASTVRNAVRPTIIVGGNNFLSSKRYKRKTYRLCLHVWVVIFSLFPDSPPILAVVAPAPSLEDAAIWLSFSAPFDHWFTGLVRADRVVKPEIRAETR